MYLWNCISKWKIEFEKKFNITITEYVYDDYNSETFWKISFNNGLYFKIREFPHQCSWLVMGRLIKSKKKECDEIATYIANKLDYSAILLSDNIDRIDEWKSLGYKELFSNYNPHSGNINMLLIKDLI